MIGLRWTGTRPSTGFRGWVDMMPMVAMEIPMLLSGGLGRRVQPACPACLAIDPTRKASRISCGTGWLGSRSANFDHALVCMGEENLQHILSTIRTEADYRRTILFARSHARSWPRH